MKKTMKLRIAVANRSALNSFKNSLLLEEDITAGIAEGFDYSLITKTLLTLSPNCYYQRYFAIRACEKE